ncbi:PIR protein [Plasmodium yoelii]|uniref:PIR protein n=2 Tax=Plasmodium yoelii TaxID=5861 RepID=A0AAF0B729_PLAYO|nr:PIR protein [Plasmodium yoelii]WBY58995.1 PIR protein [Plasmodium yoelii yoelii]CDU19190.1 YIR protein [Plasmodium yoelii]VTZ79825.1 PIR protein [Plasmodium yoelii]|eukprot:XP_022812543.1 PIR protein [Plasmodium yoelii]
MLTSRVCGEFESMWKFFSDELDESGKYNFSRGMLGKYCPKSGNCDNDIYKIDAGCLWLFNKFYGDSNNFSNNANAKIGVAVYIMVWLGYKLNKMLNTQFSNLNEFYSKHMKTVNEYKQSITGVTEYTSYIDLINKHNYVVNISNENVPKFYDAFKILCNMINNVDKKDGGKAYLEYANKFVDEYEKLFNDNNNVEGNSYNKLLCTMSNDYTVFGKTVANPKMRNKLPELTTKKKTQITSSPNVSQMDTSSPGTSTSVSEIEISDPDLMPPSLSILNKLIPISLIFVAILILLGIAYKYSLFRSRKRSQKQYLREKLKR